MNNYLFHGWRDVFSFTFKQGITTKKFKSVTLGLALVLFIAGMAISVIMAFVQKKDATEISPLQVVHVIDESNLQVLYLDGFLETNKEKYPEVSFQMEQGTVEEVSKKIAQNADSETGSKEAVLHIAETEKGYLMSLYLPEGSELSKKDGEDFLEKLTMVMEQSKLFSSNIPMEKLVLVMSSISTTILDAGDAEKSIGEELVGMIAPAVCVLFMFLMTYLYGMSIGNIVSVEKTSKLMEMMLTMTKPYSLIMGKIFATACVGILQIAIWIASLVVGFYAGHVMAGEVIYPEYTNILLQVFELLKSQDGSTAFSVSALVVAFLTICLGFLFYCVLAGTFASFADRTETVPTVMGFYQMIVMVGYFAGMMVPLQEKEVLTTLCRIIPVTSAFMLPGDIIAGNVTVLQSMLYVAILLVTTIILVVVAGKVYKNQLFYRGVGLKARFMKKKKVKE